MPLPANVERRKAVLCHTKLQVGQNELILGNFLRRRLTKLQAGGF